MSVAGCFALAGSVYQLFVRPSPEQAEVQRQEKAQKKQRQKEEKEREKRWEKYTGKK
jgi:hypothetical protein